MTRTGGLRAAVLGANDGIVSTASLVVGVASAGSAHGEVLLTAHELLPRVAMVVSIAALALLGAISARMGRAPVARAVARATFWGVAAMAATAAAGALFGMAVGQQSNRRAGVAILLALYCTSCYAPTCICANEHDVRVPGAR